MSSNIAQTPSTLPSALKKPVMKVQLIAHNAVAVAVPPISFFVVLLNTHYLLVSLCGADISKGITGSPFILMDAHCNAKISDL